MMAEFGYFLFLDEHLLVNYNRSDLVQNCVHFRLHMFKYCHRDIRKHNKAYCLFLGLVYSNKKSLTLGLMLEKFDPTQGHTAEAKVKDGYVLWILILSVVLIYYLIKKIYA